MNMVDHLAGNEPNIPPLGGGKVQKQKSDSEHSPDQ